MNPLIADTARLQFNRARSRANFSSVLNTFAPEREQLLSFDEVKSLLKPRGEKYEGLKVVPLQLIVGSEGRYHDFNKVFLPRREFLRWRWESVDRAHLGSVALPPIRLYEIGGVYFVRDGNHRVSVARLNGGYAIDAEVSSLGSEISIKPGMTHEDLRREVIRLEKEQAFSDTPLGEILSPDELLFTSTGRFAELLKHIEVHKYFINLERTDEIPFQEAARSWRDNLFYPITNLISDKKLAKRFPGRTKADLYMWMIKHWDDLKRKYGNLYPLEEAVIDYSRQYGIKKGWVYFMILPALMILRLFRIGQKRR